MHCAYISIDFECFILQTVMPLKVALAQINFLVFECAGYRAKNVRLKDKCESLEAKLEATVKYCDELSHKLKEKIDAGELD